MALMRGGRVASRDVARQLWLLRHGEAVPHGSRRDDAERELTARGERQAASAGAALSRLGIGFAACFTSPKGRARGTARLAGDAPRAEALEEQGLAERFDAGAAL